MYCGKSFKKYKTIENDQIEIIFEDDSTANAQCLIGADGINSKVRTQLFPESRLRYSGQTCWRGVAAYKINSDFNHKGVEMWGEQLRFGISRLEEGKVYWFAVALSEPNQQDDRSILKKKLHDMFIDFHPEALNLIQNTPIEKIIRTDLSELQILDTWYQDNICLIGDAAHSMTPDLGQGGGQAIEDAFYLSNMISKNKDIAKVFAEFYQLRYQKVNQIVKKSWGTGIIANIKYGKRIRNFLFRSIPDKLLKKQMIKMYRIDKTITNV
ncbi:FAD-dependent monooxygenase [Aquimarina sp. I32.4]|uniref:FAD-dependent monooxygenase n=1 Tax=Aquimarina sp. I32.4 TaxID=2053903 RepID=UPI000CDEEE04|nr:FAD-dependent monooxygenase [Aquimarina sp. I32.4]